MSQGHEGKSTERLWHWSYIKLVLLLIAAADHDVYPPSGWGFPVLSPKRRHWRERHPCTQHQHNPQPTQQSRFFFCYACAHENLRRPQNTGRHKQGAGMGVVRIEGSRTTSSPTRGKHLVTEKEQTSQVVARQCTTRNHLRSICVITGGC